MSYDHILIESIEFLNIPKSKYSAQYYIAIMN